MQIPILVQNDLYIPSVVQLYIKEFFFLKIKGHMKHVPFLSKHSKDFTKRKILIRNGAPTFE